MAKASLHFKLPEEQSEFDDALQGTRLRIAIQDLDNYLRSLAKHQDIEIIEVQAVRTKLHEILEEYELSLY